MLVEFVWQKTTSNKTLDKSSNFWYFLMSNVEFLRRPINTVAGSLIVSKDFQKIIKVPAECDNFLLTKVKFGFEQTKNSSKIHRFYHTSNN
jgi:hypothetical protein